MPCSSSRRLQPLSQVTNIFDQEMATKFRLLKAPPMSYYKCEPQSVFENSIFKLYYNRSTIPDRTVLNNRPDIPVVMFDKTIKEAYLIYVAIHKSQPSQNHHRESPEVHRLEKAAGKDMATDKGLGNTTSAIHNWYHARQITRLFKSV